MPSKKIRRAIAQIGVVISLIVIVMLIISLGNGYTHTLQFVFSILAAAAVGVNLYFLFKVLRALGLYSRKLTTLFISAAWLAVYAFLSVVEFAQGFAECAGGCASRPPSPADWLLVLATFVVGLGFNLLLSRVHSR
jgi:hypothetical protein